ncbi:MAG: FtsX-like permease family protein, partial [Thermoproteota archaeon]
AEQVENEIYKTFSYRQRLYVFYFKDLLARTASLVNVSLFVYKVAAIVVILLLIGSVVTISFLDLVKNRNEFGLLMTMGWSDKEITSYAFYHLLVLSSLGLIIGTTSTILAGNLIVERIMSSNSNLSVVMLYFPLNIPETFYVFASIVLVVVSTILSSLLLYLYLRRLTPSMLLESD